MISQVLLQILQGTHPNMHTGIDWLNVSVSIWTERESKPLTIKAVTVTSIPHSLFGSGYSVSYFIPAVLFLNLWGLVATYWPWQDWTTAQFKILMSVSGLGVNTGPMQRPC